MEVGVAVADGGAVDDHAVVEECAFALADGFEFFEEVGELGSVEVVDLGDEGFFLFVVAVVGEVVVAVGDADLRVGAITAVVGDDEGGDAGGVGLEGEGHEIKHEFDVLFVVVIVGDDGGLFGGGDDDVEFSVAVDAAFDVADGGEVFVDFAAIGGTEVGLEFFGVAHDEVEDAFVVAVAFGDGLLGGGGVAVAEETVEDGLGIDFGGHGLGGGFPGEVELVGAGVAGLAGAGGLAFVAGEFEGGESGLVAEGVGGDLVDGDGALDVCAGGFAGMVGGEEGGGGAGVIAAAIAKAVGLVVCEAGDEGEIFAVRGEGLEDGFEFVIGAEGGGGPIDHIFAVGDVDEGHAFGEGFGGGAGERGGGGAEGGGHDVEHGEGDGGAEAFEEGAAGDVPVTHFSGLLADVGGWGPLLL